jgi:hypothetical protein
MLHHGELYLAMYCRVLIIGAHIIHAHLPFMLSPGTCELDFQCNTVSFYSVVYDHQLISDRNREAALNDHDVLDAYYVYTTHSPRCHF